LHHPAQVPQSDLVLEELWGSIAVRDQLRVQRGTHAQREVANGDQALCGLFKKER
jgi:hypothetical protein